MTTIQMLITIVAVVFGTIVTRFLPFVLFPANKTTPVYIQYLSKVLPFAVMGLLIVYCLKDVDIVTAPFGIPELCGILTVAGLHIWKRNMLLSISAGTILYMFLVQLIF